MRECYSPKDSSDEQCQAADLLCRFNRSLKCAFAPGLARILSANVGRVDLSIQSQIDDELDRLLFHRCAGLDAFVGPCIRPGTAAQRGLEWRIAAAELFLFRQLIAL